ncbi:putative transcription factor Znf-LSD family [Helianthus debilis subsp. tardiflorus]
MNMLVNCSNCRTPLTLPPGAKSIRCAICQAVTPIADPSLPRPPYSGRDQSYPTGYTVINGPAATHVTPPPPYSYAPAGSPPSVHGRKKAVLVGVSYKNTNHELKGCINDAKYMKHLLITKFQFPEASIVMLTGKNLIYAFRDTVPVTVPAYQTGTGTKNTNIEIC